MIIVCALIQLIGESSIAHGSVRKLTNVLDYLHFQLNDNDSAWTADLEMNNKQEPTKTNKLRPKKWRQDDFVESAGYVLTCSMTSAIPNNSKYGHDHDNDTTWLRTWLNGYNTI